MLESNLNPKDRPRTRGAQPGNTNALKHGFYYRRLIRLRPATWMPPAWTTSAVRSLCCAFSPAAYLNLPRILMTSTGLSTF